MQPAASDGLESDASRSKDFLMLLAPLLLRLMVFRLLHFAELPFFHTIRRSSNHVRKSALKAIKS